MIGDIIWHFRKRAEGHRETFVKTEGGHNAKLFDKWADEIAQAMRMIHSHGIDGCEECLQFYLANRGEEATDA